MLGMLTFGTVIVIQRSNYLSESEIGQSYTMQLAQRWYNETNH